MAAPTTIDEAITAAALGPKSVTVDGTTVVARSVDDIKAAKDLIAATEAAAQPVFGLRFTQLISPGANR